MKKTINKNFRKTNKATVHIVKKVEDILYRAALSCSKKRHVCMRKMFQT